MPSPHGPGPHEPRARTTFEIPALCCPSEAAQIRRALESLPEGTAQVEEAQFDFSRRALTLSHQPGAEADIACALKQAALPTRRWLPVAPDTYASTCIGTSTCCEGPDASQEHGHEHNEPPGSKWRLVLAGVGALGAEGVALLSRNEHHPAVAALALVAVGVCGPPIWVQAWRTLRARRVGINLLMALAVAGALAIGHWAEAAMVTWLFTLSERIEGWTMERSRGAVSRLLSGAPSQALVYDGGVWVSRAVDSVAPGDTVRVRPGERFPLDGVVSEGQSEVDQSPLTGESLAVPRAQGDQVFAGSVNGEGVLDVRVSAAHDQTLLARLVRRVQEAQGSRAPVERAVDRFAARYTPAVVVAALLVALVPPLFDGRWSAWFYSSLVFLVASCPCALVIATPIAAWSGLTAAAKRGILIKSGRALEAAADIRVWAFDKTGTITRGKPQLLDLLTDASTCTREQALRLAAALEAPSQHPLARAVVEASHSSSDQTLPEVLEARALPGRGVTGTVEGQKLALVRRGTLALSPSWQERADALESQGRTLTVLLREPGSQVLALLGFSDQERPEAREVIEQLERGGSTVVMLTGDSAQAANSVAARVGLGGVRASLLPEDKQTWVAQQAQATSVAMVGDGINDAPALASATVGIAMGAWGSDAAIESADVALLNDDLRSIPLLRDLSRAVVARIRQNIAIALGLKLLVFALALTGNATLWLAVFADVGATLLVCANALRLLRFSH
jgi:Cd2+/Zn2+-exporting ATPase